MTSGATFSAAVSRFFFAYQAQDHYFFAFFRVAVALLFLLHFCATWQDFHLLYGGNGLLAPELSELFKESWIPSFNQISLALTQTLSTSESVNILLFQGLALAASVLLAVGLFTRPVAVLLLLLQLVLAKGSYLYAYGIDYFKTIALFYCCVFPVGSQWSMDNRLFRRRAAGPANPTPFRRVLQLHLCFVYFFSGLDKVIGYNWWNGEAVWKALHLPYNHTQLGSMLTGLAVWPLLFAFMGWVVVLIELCYPAFIFAKRTRIVWLSLTVLMHVGIMFFLNLPYFGMLMVVLNLAAFLDLRKRETWGASRQAAA